MKMSVSHKDFEKESGEAKVSVTGMFKDEQKKSLDTLPDEVGALLKEIFTINIDTTTTSAFDLKAVKVSVNDGNPEWKFEYGSQKGTGGSPSIGSFCRQDFVKALDKAKNEEKLNIEVVDRSHITIRDNHVKVLELLRDRFPEIYQRKILEATANLHYNDRNDIHPMILQYLSAIRILREGQVAKMDLFREQCQSLIDRFPAYLDSVKQRRLSP